MTDGASLATKLKLMAEFVGFAVEVETIDRVDNGVSVKVTCVGEQGPQAYINWTGHNWQVDVYAKPQKPEDTCVRKQRFSATTRCQVVEATFVALMCEFVEAEWKVRGWR